MQFQVCFYVFFIGIVWQFVDVSGTGNGDIRLRDGDYHYGRVEIYYNGVWGTVCDDSWDITDANVVCRQLGLGPAVNAPVSAFYGEGEGPILLDEIECYGNEERLDECDSEGWYNHNCAHSEDASVECSIRNGDIRLRDGDYHYGRVEIYYNGVWGTVCDDSWDITDANVVCRQLGLGPAVNAPVSAFYGEGEGPILLDEIECYGNEERLDECDSEGWYNHNCVHSEDASVECSILSHPTTPYYWVDGSVRLLGGSFPNEGRVEVYWSGSWNTVCDDSWDMNDANVVCRQVGYSSAVEAVGSAYFGQGSGDILLDEVNCMGYESSLLECQSNGLYQHDCSHSEDSGVICHPAAVAPPSYDSVRLAGSTSNKEGRVEIYNENEWGTVCDDYWDYSDALVVCRQLGFGSVSTFYSGAYFGTGSGPILRRLDCDGDESSWTHCYYAGWDTNECSHSEDAGVSCADPVSEGYFKEGSVRLLGSTSVNIGRVEIYHHGTWGTVCDDGWGISEADVVCRQLGYPNGAYGADESAYFGEGDGPILLDEVSCNGWEHYLTDCRHNGWYDHNCAHSEDAGARCNIPDRYYPRLVNGTKWYEGRVEVWNYYQWEGLCSNAFYEDEARTVCKQLGFSDVEIVYYYEKFGNNFDVASSVYFDCRYYDTKLSSCSRYPADFGYCEATAIRCKYDESLSGGAIAAIVLGVLLFVSIFLVTCVTVHRQMSRKNRRPPPNVAVISGTENAAYPQSAPPTTQGTPQRSQPSINEQAPPTYNDAISNPVYYPPVNFHASITPQPHGEGTAMQASFTVNPGYPPQPISALPHVQPIDVVHPPVPQVNQNMSQPYPTQGQHYQLSKYKNPTQPLALCATTIDSTSTPQANTQLQQSSIGVTDNSPTPTDNPVPETTHPEQINATVQEDEGHYYVI